MAPPSSDNRRSTTPEVSRSRSRSVTTGEQLVHYQKALGSPARREASAVFPREITASRAFLADVEAGLTDIAAFPALIIWGDSDFAFGDNELRRWEQALTDHQTVIIKGAGHFVPSDAPEQFAAAIRRWHTPSGE